MIPQNLNADAALRAEVVRRFNEAKASWNDAAVSVCLRLVKEERERGRKDAEALCEVVRAAMTMRMGEQAKAAERSLDCARADMQMHARDADQWAERAKIAENELAKEQAVSEKLRDNDRYAAIICKEIRNESKEDRKSTRLNSSHH